MICLKNIMTKTESEGSKFKKKNKSYILYGLFLIAWMTMLHILLNYVVLVTWVASESMEPTLMTGGNCFMNRLAYYDSEPQRGDIVSFYSRENELDETKRIVGIPQDEISFANGNVYINGQIYDEDYLPEGTRTFCQETFRVPDGCYFVMGDNREWSYDSRDWYNPYISKDDIVAKNIFFTDIVIKIKGLFTI